MKARYLTLLAFAVITAAMTMSLLFVARRIVLAHFLALENQHVKEDIRRAVRHLDSELQELDRTAKDYASWDDTYDYMRSRRAEYLRSNYTDVSVANLKLRAVVLLDPNGHIVYVGSWHRNGKHTELDADMRTLQKAAGLLTAGSKRQSMTGIITLSDGPVLASMRAILTTAGQGPSRGTLIMLRDLDDRLLAKISLLTDVPVTVFAFSSGVAPAPTVVEDGIHRVGESLARDIDDNEVAVIARLSDWFGHPSYEIEIRHAREFWQQGKHAYRFLMYSILAFGCVSGALGLLLTQLCFVHRIEALTRFAQQIKNEEGLKSRITFRWKDEISILAGQINHMLEDLQSSHDKLALARERLQHEATHDSLTGVWNCAAALELLDREIARSERENGHIAVFMIDIDHFKRVNDEFGHVIGDCALLAIAASMAKILRTTDILARYGGEEFLVFAPNCNLAEARRLADRLLLRVQSTAIDVGDQKLTMTVSIGLVSGGYPLTSEELIALADRALYRAKEKGRNRFECEDAQPAPVKGTLYCMPRRTV
jgi:diguanylate cyclase (GGDEF)-like protein